MVFISIVKIEEVKPQTVTFHQCFIYQLLKKNKEEGLEDLNTPCQWRVYTGAVHVCGVCTSYVSEYLQM